ncbi:MAG: hypothetical protein HYU66_00815 [Armatimonadetes bacterium]|nr:hypothetical protein [Armatimonadota bacterium]
MSAAEAAEPARPGALAGLLDVLLVLCVVAAGGLTFLAGRPPDDAAAMAQPAGLFYRLPVVGMLQHGGRLVPFAALLLAAAVALLLQAALPVGAEARGGTAAFGFLLLLGPVLSYAPQVAVLATLPEDAKALGMPVLDRFYPLLPVTWPLLAGLTVAAIRCVVPPRPAWPAPAKAFAFVTILLGAGGAWLNWRLVQARGNALGLAYLQWPMGIAAAWQVGQIGLAGVLVALAAREEKPSRVVAALTAALLIGAAVATRGAA